jgi:hypothetical protein
MERYATPLTREKFDHPAFDARFIRGEPQLGAPTGNLVGGYARNLAIDELAERRTHVALHAEEPDEQGTAARVHLMSGIGPHPYGATLPPRLLASAAYDK